MYFGHIHSTLSHPLSLLLDPFLPTSPPLTWSFFFPTSMTHRINFGCCMTLLWSYLGEHVQLSDGYFIEEKNQLSLPPAPLTASTCSHPCWNVAGQVSLCSSHGMFGRQHHRSPVLQLSQPSSNKEPWRGATDILFRAAHSTVTKFSAFQSVRVSAISVNPLQTEGFLMKVESGTNLQSEFMAHCVERTLLFLILSLQLQGQFVHHPNVGFSGTNVNLLIVRLEVTSL